MNYKIFLDANFLLDFLLKRDNYPQAKVLMSVILGGEAKGYITPAIVHILGYWLTKAYGSDKAKQLLVNLLVEIQIIDITHELILLALNSKIDDIEDALQYYTAIHNGLNYFISGDKKLQKSALPILPVLSADHFLENIWKK